MSDAFSNTVGERRGLIGVDERDVQYLRECVWARRVLEKLVEIGELARGEDQVLMLLRRRSTPALKVRAAYQQLVDRRLIDQRRGGVVVSAAGREAITRARR